MNQTFPNETLGARLEKSAPRSRGLTLTVPTLKGLPAHSFNC
jgi:hypothetical protein